MPGFPESRPPDAFHITELVSASLSGNFCLTLANEAAVGPDVIQSTEPHSGAP